MGLDQRWRYTSIYHGPFLAGCRAALAGGRWALHLRGPSETMVDLGAHAGR